MALTPPVIASAAWQSSCCARFGVMALLKRLYWIAASQAPRNDGMLPWADRKSNRMRTIMAEVLGITGLQIGPA
jgi:hypothetical protein